MKKTLFAFVMTILISSSGSAQEIGTRASASFGVIAPRGGFFLYSGLPLVASTTGTYFRANLDRLALTDELLEGYVSAEVGYASIKATRTWLLLQNLPKMRVGQLFALIGIELSSKSSISPFVRARLGASRVSISPDSASSFSVSGQYWSFAVGLGGGVRYRITRSVGIALTADYLGSIRDRITLVNGGGGTEDFGGPIGSFPFGLSLEYDL